MGPLGTPLLCSGTGPHTDADGPAEAQHSKPGGTPQNPLLGGSWVVIRGVISRVTILILRVRVVITLLELTHEGERAQRCIHHISGMCRKLSKTGLAEQSEFWVLVCTPELRSIM